MDPDNFPDCYFYKSAISRLSTKKWKCCDGVTNNCNGIRITEIKLNSVGLSGQFPVEFCSLFGLTNLDLGGNQLGGAIPDQLGNLIKLVKLDLSNNLFNGSLPSSLAGFTDLEVLNVGKNQLVDPLPFLGSLEKLTTLNLAGNGFEKSTLDRVKEWPNYSHFTVAYANDNVNLLLYTIMVLILGYILAYGLFLVWKRQRQSPRTNSKEPVVVVVDENENTVNSWRDLTKERLPSYSSNPNTLEVVIESMNRAGVSPQHYTMRQKHKLERSIPPVDVDFSLMVDISSKPGREVDQVSQGTKSNQTLMGKTLSMDKMSPRSNSIDLKRSNQGRLTKFSTKDGKVSKQHLDLVDSEYPRTILILTNGGEYRKIVHSLQQLFFRTNQILEIERGSVPKSPNQIELVVGDQVEVSEYYENGYCFGYNHRSGKEGYFPFGCLKLSAVLKVKIVEIDSPNASIRREPTIAAIMNAFPNILQLYFSTGMPTKDEVLNVIVGDSVPEAVDFYINGADEFINACRKLLKSLKLS